MPATPSRRMWHLLEPIHAIVYFVPEALDEFAAAGLKGGWMGYFAGRAGPMGAVPAEVVIATFYNFAPQMVRRSVPDAWSFSTPEAAVAARLRIADTALRRQLGDSATGAEVREAVELLRVAVAACRPEGRPLYAGHAAQPWPDEPHLALWHAATLVREHRGDGHVAALVAAGLDGCEAHVTVTASGAVPLETVRPWRGWTDEQWAAAVQRLRDRGWVADDGTLTDEGRTQRAALEASTDESASAPWRALGPGQADRLAALLQPMAAAVSAALPFPNPVGLPRPA